MTIYETLLCFGGLLSLWQCKDRINLTNPLRSVSVASVAPIEILLQTLTAVFEFLG
jgi:hypothetical protein